jgi:hypothetical protein
MHTSISIDVATTVLPVIGGKLTDVARLIFFC